MLAAAAALLLTGGAGIVDTWDVGLRTDVRGTGGAPAGAQTRDPAPVELAPWASLALADRARTLTLSASYTPRFMVASELDGGRWQDRIYDLHQGRLTSLWLPDRRTRLRLSADGTTGMMEVSPLTQASVQPRPQQAGAIQPILLPAAGVRAAAFDSFGGGARADFEAAPRLTVGGSVGLFRSGGADALARTVFPLHIGTTVEGHADLATTPRDRVSVHLAGQRYVFPGTRRSDLGTAAAVWRHSPRPTLQTHVGAGVAVSEEASLDGRTPGGGEISPRFELAVTSTLSAAVRDTAASPAADASLLEHALRDRRTVQLYALARLAPHIDPFSGRVVSELEGVTAIASPLRAWLTASADARGSSVLRSGQLSPPLLVGQGGVWIGRGGSFETGVLVRCAYQRNALPEAAPVQWGVTLVGSYRARP